VSVDAIRDAFEAFAGEDPEPLVALMTDKMEWRGLDTWGPPPS
jgi:hypothetical protein